MDFSFELPLIKRLKYKFIEPLTGLTRENIANYYSIKEILEALGFKVLPSNFIISPYHPDEQPTVRIYPKLNLYRDFTLGWCGDSIGFLANFYCEMDLYPAAKRMETLIIEGKIKKSNYKKEYFYPSLDVKYLDTEVFNFNNKSTFKDFKSFHETSDDLTKELVAWKFIGERMQFQNFVYQRFLRFCEGLDEESINYLTNKGLKLETLEKFKVFSIKDFKKTAEFVEELIKEVDWYLVTGLYENNKFFFQYHKIIIPFYECEQFLFLRALYFHNNSDIPPKGLSKYLSPSNYYGDLTPKRLFNINILNELSLNDPLIICESEIQTMIADQLGFKAVGILGINNFPLDEVEVLKNFDVHFLLVNNKLIDNKINMIKELFNKSFKVIKLKKHDSLTKLNIETGGLDLLSNSEFIQIVEINNQ